MKYMIASDLHGSELYGKKLIERFLTEGADKLVLLGDLYYHGPRNPFPEGYAPLALSKLLNENKAILTVVRGNCDSEVDQMISEFPFQLHIAETVGGKKFFFTHGHVYNEENIPDGVDVLVYGHFHVNFIKKVGDVWVANPGSVSLPKDGTPRGYLLTDGVTVTLKDLNGAVLQEEVL